MTKNPIINAFGASAYITLVASVMSLISKTQSNKPDPFFAPVVFLSLLTLSVTVMAYLFFYQPVQLFISGKKKEALKLFIQTVGVFGVITTVVSVLIFSGIV